MEFSHLHCHSHYSLLDGLPKIDELLNFAKELGMKSLALTDHGAIYGAVEFYKKAKEIGIKPIIGCELYLAFEKMWQRRPKIDDKRYHIVLLVKNEQGYKNLVKLITKSHLEGFYYKPRIDEDLLFSHSEGLVCLTGCIQGKFPRLIVEKRFEEAEKLTKKYLEVFGRENFYFELQHHPNIKEQKIANKGLLKLAKKYQVEVVATNDVHYLRPEDAKIQDILMLINTGADPNDPERLTMICDDFSMRSKERMIEDFKEIPEAIENTQKISEICTFEFKLSEIKLPKFETKNQKSPEEFLRELCLQGLEKRYSKNPPKEVIERMEYELKIINEMGFSSYFLIVQDVVNFAKKEGIMVGPGRGSVAGSLVAYLLGITNVDPLKHSLLFERFLNPERSAGLPDIDIDFADRRRDEVIEYVAKKYGRNRVAQIITFGTMAARVAVRDVGRVLNYPYSFCDKIAKLIPQGMSLDEALAKVPELREKYQSDEKVEKLIDIARKLEGVARHASTHACGVIISSLPLDEICPLQRASQEEKTIVTQFDMHSLEELGLLKIDFLGLKNLTLIEDTIKIVEKRHQIKIDIEKIPFDDKKTFELLQRGETISVFQLESEGMRKCLKQLKPTNFDDIVAILALYRPGPMNFISEYIERKNKKKKIEYLHPKLKPILDPTYGIPLYQEQIMEIAKELAGFSLAEADLLRKAIGKKIKNLLLEQKEKFIEGCKKNGIEEKVAKKIWEWIEPFAHYSFNKSHSTSYAIIAYQTAYLKANFPLEFMAAVLTLELNDVERIGFLIEEVKRMGIEVLPPDINESLWNFTVVEGKKEIRFGFLGIKNVGKNVVVGILKERKERGPFKSMEDFLLRIDPKVLNKKSLESLIKAGVFDRFYERNLLLENLETLLEFARTKKINHNQKTLFGSQKEKLNLKPAPPASKFEKMIWEKELLGIFLSSHPLEDFKNFSKGKVEEIRSLKNLQNLNLKKMVKIGGIVSKIKKILTRGGQPMFFLDLEDLTDKIEVVVFPNILLKNPISLEKHKIIFVSGKLEEKDGVPKLIAEEIEEIMEA